jgi:hypothetical protein
MEKHILSKSTFIRGNQCLKSLYLNKKRPFLRDRISPEQRAKFSRGHKIGDLAQQLFPGGIDMRPKSPTQYQKRVLEVRHIIDTGTHNIIYEASFQYDQLLAILDILIKNDKGWTAFEVKSSLGISDTYILDAAFQYYVITNSGLKLNDFFLIHIDPDYKFEGIPETEKLFNKVSVLDKVLKLQDYIREQAKRGKEALKLEKSPSIEPSDHCINPYPCDFMGHCWKKIPQDERPKLNYGSEKFYDFLKKMQ